MTVRLFDVQTGFGGLVKGEAVPVAAEEWLDEMERLDIDRALARTAPDEQERDVPGANAILFAACAGHERLVPCPVVVPNTADDLAPEAEQAADAIARGAGAAWIRPAKDGWVLRDWSCGALFRALEGRRLPAFCLLRDVTFEQLGELAGTYRELPFLLAGVAFREQRIILPLLETFPNVHLSIGNRYTTHAGLEQLVARIGADRLLFGTGFPESEAMMAVTQLMYAAIPECDKAKIGAANFERLMEGIRR